MQSFFTGGIDGFGGCSHPRWDPRVRLGTVARCWPTRGTARCRPCTRSPLCTGSGTVSAGTGHRGFSCCSFTSARPSPSKRLDWSGSRGNCRSSGSAPQGCSAGCRSGGALGRPCLQLPRGDNPSCYGGCQCVTHQAGPCDDPSPVQPIRRTVAPRQSRTSVAAAVPVHLWIGSSHCTPHRLRVSSAPTSPSADPDVSALFQQNGTIVASLKESYRIMCIGSCRFRGVWSKT